MVFPITANNRKDKKTIKGLIKTFEVCYRFAKKQGVSFWLELHIIDISFCFLHHIGHVTHLPFAVIIFNLSHKINKMQTIEHL